MKTIYAVLEWMSRPRNWTLPLFWFVAFSLVLLSLALERCLAATVRPLGMGAHVFEEDESGGPMGAWYAWVKEPHADDEPEEVGLDD